MWDIEAPLLLVAGFSFSPCVLHSHRYCFTETCERFLLTVYILLKPLSAYTYTNKSERAHTTGFNNLIMDDIFNFLFYKWVDTVEDTGKSRQYARGSLAGAQWQYVPRNSAMRPRLINTRWFWSPAPGSFLTHTLHTGSYPRQSSKHL